MTRSIVLFLAGLGSGCGGETGKNSGTTIVDLDSDGVAAELDCDDEDPALGSIEEDGDCDGYLVDEDCNDSNPHAWPGAPETSMLSPDLDCDGEITQGGSLTRADVVFVAADPSGNSALGTRVASAGDVDGDGMDDLIMSDAGWASGAPGKVYLFFGATLPEAGEVHIADADVTMNGSTRDGSFGDGLSTAGDIDGDGLDDIAIVAPWTGTGGTVFVYSGADLVPGASLGETDATWTITGTRGLEPVSVDGGADFDGDGRDDLVIGGWTNLGDSDVWVFSGADLVPGATSISSATLTIEGDREVGLGTSVAFLGDVDGDGRTDLGMGAVDSYWDSSLFILFGATAPSSGSISLWDCDVTYTESGIGDSLGFGLDGAGDVDGDGLDDVVVGAPYYESRSEWGGAWVLFGTDLYSGLYETIHPPNLSSSVDGNSTGWSVGGAGDVDGDGLGDVIVGDPYLYAGRIQPGGAWVVSGAELVGGATVALDDVEHAFTGPSDYSSAGESVAVADVDGDGRSDILITAPWTNSGGSVYLLRSRY